MALFLGTQLISDITTPIVSPIPQTIVAGETPVLYAIGKFDSADKENFVEATESAITIPRSGTYRIKFSCINLYNSIMASNAYAQLWVNHAAREDGESFLIPKYSIASTFEYSEDIMLEYGDVVTIALKSASTTYSVVSMSIIACIDWETGF